MAALERQEDVAGPYRKVFGILRKFSGRKVSLC